jgi:hypothetical protein
MANPAKKYGYNAEPRLSANQLAEYLKASSTRRKSIVREAKFPKVAVVTRYRYARQSLIKYLCDPTRSLTTLAESIIDLQDREASLSATPWQKDDYRLSVEAITAFQKAQNSLGLAKLDCYAAMTNPPKLDVAGVDISVWADVLPMRTDKDGTARVGAVMLLFSKSESSAKGRDDLCRVSALLAALFAEKHLGFKGAVDPKLCLAIDVFSGKAHRAPATFVKALDNIQNACEEVAMRWEKVEVPADYDGPTLVKAAA